MADKTASSVHDTKGGVAAVILAAGESSRMGSTKPLLAWDGKTLLRHCAERPPFSQGIFSQEVRTYST